MSITSEMTRTVAIIGGGVSGALTAYHLSRKTTGVCIVVIDPHPVLGLGLAYSTPSLRHLLNVPAGKISALASEPMHFLNWVHRHFDPGAEAETFVPRAVFGRYISSLLAETHNVEQIQASVLDLEQRGTGALLTLDSGVRLSVDCVVLALGNFDPATLSGIADGAVRSGAYCHNAWLPSTYENLAPEAPVTLIGTGLTGVDVLLRLRELGHRGTITAISRHGIFPNRHAHYTAAARMAIPFGTVPTCLAYVRAIREAIAQGVEWRAAVDSLRTSSNDLWLALPLAERKRFRRHLQRRWDVVRHRMAPSISDVIEAELGAGTLIVQEGHLKEVNASEVGADVVILTASGEEGSLTSRVINCTGPNMNYRRVNSPLLTSLFARGLATPGPLGGGLNTSRCGALIDAQEQTSYILFNVGPGRLGTLIESIAISEIRQQAVEVAAIVAGQLARTGRTQHLPLSVPHRITDMNAITVAA